MNSANPQLLRGMVGVLFARRAALLLAFLLWSLTPQYSSAQFAGARQDVVAVYLFNGQDERTYRNNLELRSRLQLAHIAEVTQLDEATAAKLKLAIQGDINRFYRCISTVREKTKGFDLQDQEDMQKAWQEVLPLQQRVTEGLFEEGSLFKKVLEASLSVDQQSAYENYLQERRAAQTQAILRMTIADVERTIPMLAKQRTALLAHLIKKMPPRTIPHGYEPFVGYLMLRKLSDEELTECFDNAQRQAFQKLMKQYDGYEQAVTW